MSKTIYKTTTAGFDAGLNGILSDLSEDAYGDIVGDPTHPALGWDIDSTFAKNPIALLGHNSEVPIGVWKDPHVANGALHATLHLAPAGSTRIVDETRALLSAGVLKGISVGFRATKSQPRNNGGVHYLRQVLCEASICAIPANPSALLQAKALGISAATIQKVFRPQTATERARATLARVEARMQREWLQTAVGQKALQEAETIEKFSRHAAKHRDPPKPAFEGQTQTWRGVKLPGLSWRGQKV